MNDQELADLRKRHAAYKAQAKDPKTQRNVTQLYEEQQASFQEAAQRNRESGFYQSEDFKQANQRGIDKRRDLYYSDPEYWKNVVEKTQTPEWIQEHQERLQRINTDPEIHKRKVLGNRKVNGRAVTGPQGSFETITDFTAATGMNFLDKRRLLPHLYYYTKDGPGAVKHEKVYHTPEVFHSSMLYCWKHHYDAIDERWKKLLHKPWIKWFNHQAKHFPDQYYITIEAKREWTTGDRYTARR